MSQNSFRYSDCWSPSRGRIIVMLRSKCTSIRLNASLASASDRAPIGASNVVAADVVRTFVLHSLDMVYRQP